MKGIDAITRRLDLLKERMHAGLIPTTDENEDAAWLDGSEAITLMLELSKFQRDHGQLSPQGDLLSQVGLWSRAELDENTLGSLPRTTKKRCQGIMGGE